MCAMHQSNAGDVPWISIDSMQQGSALLKFGRSGAPHFRKFTLSPDCRYLSYFSSKKDESDRRVLLERAQLLLGQQTDIFRRNGREGLADLSFSILSSTQSAAETGIAAGSKSLNLAAKDRRELEIWLRGLRYLVRGPPPPALLAARREQLLQMARHRKRIAQAGLHFAGGDSAAAAAVEHDAGAVTHRMQQALELHADSRGSERAAVTSDPGGDLAQELQMGIRKKCDVLAMGASAFGQCGHGHPLLAYSELGGGRSASEVHVGGGGPGSRGHRKQARRCAAAAGGLGSPASQHHTSTGAASGGMHEWAYAASPRMVNALLGKAVRQLACGAAHSMALSETGEVYVWGDGDNGRLGLGSTQHVGTPRRLSRGGGEAPPSSAAYRFTFLAAGHRHSLGVSEQGVLHTWGCNSHGQLGLGDTSDRLRPTPVMFHGGGGAGDGDARSSTSSPHARSMSQFSLNQNSLLGRSQLLGSSASMDDAAHASTGPAAAQWEEAGHTATAGSLLAAAAASDTPSFVVSGAAGAAFTVVLDEAGRLYTAGDNRHGQLGLGTSAPLPPVSPSAGAAPRQASDTALHQCSFRVIRHLVALDESVVSVACGAHHSGAVGLGGRLWMWGWNGTGALGTGNQRDSNTPLHVSALGERVVTVSCGAAHTVAVALEGGSGASPARNSAGAGSGALFMAWAWGAAGHGQLGHVLLPVATDRLQADEGDGTPPVQAVPSATLSAVLALARDSTAQVAGAGGAEHPLTIGCIPVLSLCVPHPRRMMAPLATQLAATLLPSLPAASTPGAAVHVPAAGKVKLGVKLEAQLKEAMLKLISEGRPLTDIAERVTPRSLLHLAVASPSDLCLPATDTITKLLSGVESVPAGNVRTAAAGHFHTAVVTSAGRLMVAGCALDGRLGVDVPPAPPLPETAVHDIERNATSALGGYTVTPAHIDAARQRSEPAAPGVGAVSGKVVPQVAVSSFTPADVFSIVALDATGAVVQSLQDLHDMGLGGEQGGSEEGGVGAPQEATAKGVEARADRVHKAGRGSVAEGLMAVSSTRRRLSVTQSSRVLLHPTPEEPTAGEGDASPGKGGRSASGTSAAARRSLTVYSPPIGQSALSGPVVLFGYMRKRCGLLVLPLALAAAGKTDGQALLTDAQAVANAAVAKLCMASEVGGQWDTVPSIVRAGDRLLRVQGEHMGVSATLLDDLSGRTDAQMHDISAAAALQALMLTPDTLLGMGTRWDDAASDAAAGAAAAGGRSGSITIPSGTSPRHRASSTAAAPLARPGSFSMRPTSMSLAFEAGGAGVAAAAAAAAASSIAPSAVGRVLGPAAADLFTVSGQMGGSGRFGVFSDSMSATLALVKGGAVDVQGQGRGRSSLLLDSMAGGGRQTGRGSMGATSMSSMALGASSTYRPSASPELQHWLTPAQHCAVGAGSVPSTALGVLGSPVAGHMLSVASALGHSVSLSDGAGSSTINTLGVGLTLVEALVAKEVRAVSCGGAHTVVLVAKEWIGDAEAAHCMRCSSKFTFSVRRHHCRNCGGVFCAKCSSHKHPLLTLGFVDAVRVCDGCHSLLNAVAGQDDQGDEEHLRELGVW